MKKKQNNKENIEMSIEEFEKFAEEMENIPTCDICMNCMYVEDGDMYCDLTVDTEKEDVKWVYDNFTPTDDYMWCDGKHFEEK